MMKLFSIGMILFSMSCTHAKNERPDMGNAGGFLRGVAKPKNTGNGTHNGRGYPNDRRERKASENRQNRKSPPGGDARNSTVRT